MTRIPLGQSVKFEQAGELGHPGAVADPAVGIVGRGPHLIGDLGEEGGGVEREVEPDRVRQALPGQPFDETVSAAGGVGADQHCPSRPSPGPVGRELPQRGTGDCDVVGDGVGAGVARPQHDLQRLTAARLAMIEKRTQRVEAIAAFEGRSGLLLVAVCGDQRRVDVDDNRSARVDTVIGSVLAGQLPYPAACLRSGGIDRGQHRRQVSGQRGDRAGDGRVGCDPTVHTGLGSQHSDVGEAVSTHGQRQRKIADDLGRIVSGGRLPPRREPSGQAQV
jgi:hypothetical protein